MEHSCKFCGKNFSTAQALGGHVVNCSLNPNKRLYKHKQVQLIKRLLNCSCCGKEYEIECNENIFSKSKYRKCCSSKCSHALSVKNTNLTDKNEKIKEFHKSNKSNKKQKIKKCEECNKEFLYTGCKNKNRFCSIECSNKSRSRKLRDLAIKHNLGGLNPKTTYKNFKQGIYKGIRCDSSWELVFVIYCLEHNYNIERNTKPLQYTFEGKVHNFYPDFIVDGKLFEIKGFWTDRNLAKLEQCKDVIFIDKKSIKKYINYVVEKYGEDYINLYEK